MGGGGRRERLTWRSRKMRPPLRVGWCGGLKCAGGVEGVKVRTPKTKG